MSTRKMSPHDNCAQIQKVRASTVALSVVGEGAGRDGLRTMRWDVAHTTAATNAATFLARHRRSSRKTFLPSSSSSDCAPMVRPSSICTFPG